MLSDISQREGQKLHDRSHLYVESKIVPTLRNREKNGGFQGPVEGEMGMIKEYKVSIMQDE